MEKNLMVIMVMVAVWVFLTACSVSPISGMSMAPGFKVGNVIMVRNVPTKISAAASFGQSQEIIIQQMLLESERAWNSKDVDKILKYFSEDAQIMFGRKKKIISKKEFSKILPSALSRLGIMKRNYPNSIKVNGKQAEIDVMVSYSGLPSYVWLQRKILLVLSGKKWLVKKSIFISHFKGDFDPRMKKEGGELLDES